MTFKERRCKNCGEGTIRPLAKPGRFMAYRTIPSLEVPATLAIPTCDSCEAEWINDDVAESIDAAMEGVYRTKLLRIAIEAIDRIVVVINQKALESLLGLSDGYVSKIKRGERTPSPDLVVNLSMIATDPKRRLREVKDVWATQDTTAEH